MEIKEIRKLARSHGGFQEKGTELGCMKAERELMGGINEVVVGGQGRGGSMSLSNSKDIGKKSYRNYYRCFLIYACVCIYIYTYMIHTHNAFKLYYHPVRGEGGTMLFLDTTGYQVRNPGRDSLISKCWSAG